jgi:hypothetical protein
MIYLKALAVGVMTALVAGVLALVVQILLQAYQRYSMINGGAGIGAVSVGLGGPFVFLPALLAFGLGFRRTLRILQRTH